MTTQAITMPNSISRSIRKRPKSKQYATNNIIEALRSIPGGIAQSLGDSAKKTIDPIQWEKYLGFGKEEKSNKKFSGEMRAGQEIDLRSVYLEEAKQEPNLDIDPGIDYHRQVRNAEKISSQRLNQETKNAIQEILVELKKIIADTVQALGATDIAKMGPVIGKVMAQVKGKADGETVSRLVKEALGRPA